MDSNVDLEVIEPSKVRSEGLIASLGEKRQAGNGELEVRSLKKAKNSGELAANMKKAAEIVLVLATMGKTRGGRNPSPAEIEMMTEAKAKLVDICQGFAPKDVFPTHAFGAVIEDLGLSKLREQRLGFRPPHKMSISDKLKLTKQKMEKSEEFALQSATNSSQRLQTSIGLSAESRGTSPAVQTFSSEKPSQAPTSSGGFRATSPLGYVSASNSTPLPYQLPTSEVRPVVSSGLPSSNFGRDSSLLAQHRADRPHLRVSGNSNGAPCTSQVQAKSSGDHRKTPAWSMQPQSASSAKVVSDNKVPVHASVKVVGAADMARVGCQSTTSEPSLTRTTSVNLPSIHQHIQQQGVKFVQAPSLSNSHHEISKVVQKLKSEVLDHTIWTPPSRDYMNKALDCQICKVNINEVDNVLVCDVCEKGYHLKCLQQLQNQISVPRDDWHCGKCLSMSNGQHLPPKYGPVVRNNTTAPKVFSNATVAVQLSVEGKVGTSDGKKVNLQKITTNSNSSTQTAPTGTIEIKCSSHFAAGLEMADARVMQGNNTLSNKGKKVDGKKVDVLVERKKMGADSKSQPLEDSERVMKNTSDHSQTIGHLKDNDQTEMPSISENPSKQCPDANLRVELEKSCAEEILVECNSSNDETKKGEGLSVANPVESTGPSIRPRDDVPCLQDDLHDVDWIGDILQVVNEKTYYQSCSIHGVVYKVQDHALFRSNNNILTPSKLQSMWEDNKTGSKWVVASQCYFPADLPKAVGCPYAPEIYEVYESNHDSPVRASLIEGPCKVLPSRAFTEESERRSCFGQEQSGGLYPLFICKWFYDELKGVFRTVTS